jgi:DHA2 family methylenomycin A resistance protein-like MFS transporter
LVCAAAPTASVLIGLRALLGVAGAACLPSSLALITQLYPDPASRARALGAWAATTGTALVAGPLAGGVLVDLGGRRAVFLVNVPLAALSLVLTGRVGGLDRPVAGRVRWRQQVAACLVLASVTEGVVAAQPLAVVPAVVGALLRRWSGLPLRRSHLWCRNTPVGTLPASPLGRVGYSRSLRRGSAPC